MNRARWKLLSAALVAVIMAGLMASPIPAAADNDDGPIDGGDTDDGLIDDDVIEPVDPDPPAGLGEPGPGVGEPWIVNLGDSAISGEGGRWAGNTDRGSIWVDALGPKAYHDGGGKGTITSQGGNCVDAPQRPGQESVVELAPCRSASTTQEWELRGDGTVRSGDSWCLTAKGTAALSAVELASCIGSGNQKWKVEIERLVHVASGRCLEPLGISPGDQFQINVCRGAPSTFQQLGLPSTSEQIGGCHRSRSAAVHIERSSSVAEPDIRDLHSVNFACSGAETTTARFNFGPGEKYKPGIDFAPTPPGLPSNHKGQALLLEEFAQSHNVVGVTLLVGANNFGFSNVLTSCVMNFVNSSSGNPDLCSDDPPITSRVSQPALTQLETEIGEAIDNVELAMSNAGYSDSMYTLYVHTYWGVMPMAASFRYQESGWSRFDDGGCGVWDADADWGEVVARRGLNNAVRGAVAAESAPNIKLVDLQSLTQRHELCNRSVDHLENTSTMFWPDAYDEVEWVTMARGGPLLEGVGRTDYQMQEGGHANYWGQLAMRNCLRQAYNDGNPRDVWCQPLGGLNRYGEPNVTHQRPTPTFPRPTVRCTSLANQQITCLASHTAGAGPAVSIEWSVNGVRRPGFDGLVFMDFVCTSGQTEGVRVTVVRDGRTFTAQTNARCIGGGGGGGGGGVPVTP